MEHLEDKYYKTIGKNIALELELDLPQEMWINLGRYAWMVTQFVQAERNRDLRESVNQAQWGDEKSEKRMDVISQNGNVGYE
jgi:predicted lipid carrier protein YhbT